MTYCLCVGIIIFIMYTKISNKILVHMHCCLLINQSINQSIYFDFCVLWTVYCISCIFTVA